MSVDISNNYCISEIDEIRNNRELIKQLTFQVSHGDDLKPDLEQDTKVHSEINSNSNKNEKNNTWDERCLGCGKNSLRHVGGYITCIHCNLINNSIIDYGQEWRYYGTNDNKSYDPTRCGMPTNNLLPKSSMGSVIGANWNESYKMKTIRNIHCWSIDYRESSLIKNFDIITTMARNSGIPSCIIEEAKILYSMVSKDKITRGVNKTATQAASVQCACKIKGFPRNSDEMAEMFGISKKAMRKAAKDFEEIWNAIKDTTSHGKNINLYPSSSIHYIHRFCSNLNLSDDVYQVCRDICEIVEKEKILSTHIPLSRAAGCIYLVAFMFSLNISKEDIFKSCGVSEVTTNKCFQKLHKHLNAIIPDYLKDCL